MRSTRPTERLVTRIEKIHRSRGELTMKVMARRPSFLRDRLEGADAENAQELRGVLTGELHLSADFLVDGGVPDLLGGEGDPDLAPVIAAALNGDAAGGKLERIEGRTVVDQSAVLAVALRTPHVFE